MKYLFNVTLTDKDYYDFNVFIMTKSRYHKKQIVFLRILTAAAFVLLMVSSVVGKDFSDDTVVLLIGYGVLLVLFQLALTPFFKLVLKSTLKNARRHGKAAYSPQSTIEFSDSFFTETTSENKNKIKYSSVEKVCIMENKAVYLCINHAMAYIIPISCFESDKALDEFIGFIKTRTNSIEFYKA